MIVTMDEPKMTARQVFMFAPSPDKFVSVTVGGDFDSDIWHALNGFVRQMETRPVLQEAQAKEKPKPCCPYWSGPVCIGQCCMSPTDRPWNERPENQGR